MGKKLIKYLVFAVFLFAVTLYCTYLFVLPKVINSANPNGFRAKIEKIITKKTDLILKHKGLYFKPSYNLSSNVSIEEFELVNGSNKKIVSIKNANIYFRPFKIFPKKIKADYLLFNKTGLKQQNKKSSKKINLNIKNLPELEIKKALFIFDDKNTLKISITDLYTNKISKKYTLNGDILINSKYLKNNLNSKINDSLYLENGQIFVQNLEIYSLNNPLKLNGHFPFDNSKEQYGFTVHSKNFPIADIEKMFLFYSKQNKPNDKNFIENFYDFRGQTDLNLLFEKSSITGNAVIKDFRFKTVKFSIPFYFPKADFIFSKDKITLKENGLFGGEKVFTDFYTENLFSKDKIVKGSVVSSVGKKFIRKYIPYANITGYCDLSVKYFIKNRKITVEYLAKIPKGADVFYKKANLGIKDKNRRIYAKTFKENNQMFLKTYDYSMFEGKNLKNIVTGDGLFVKNDKKYRLDFITAQTKGKVPAQLIGVLDDFIENGYFEGQLKYYAKNKLILGTFNLYDTDYKNFHVEKASVEADSKNMLISAKGTFEKEPYSAKISLKNGFKDNILIYNLDLYLKEYIIKRKTDSKRRPTIKIDSKKNINWTINRAHLKLDRLRFKKIVLENLDLEGLAQDNMAYFDMPDIAFANGTLKAKGIYDLDYDASDIEFEANNIDSNSAADMVFNLKDQFEGNTNAKMHVKTYDKLKYIEADAAFSIQDGALTKIGSTEFLVKNSKRKIKFKLSDIINVDIKKMQALKSNLDGSFKLHNQNITDVEIYAKHKFLSLFLEGQYNVSTQMGCACLWGKYNKNAQKGIKILFVPLSLITKIIFKNENTMHLYQKSINKIPPIEASAKEQEIFMVKIDGNLNNASELDIKLKSIK